MPRKTKTDGLVNGANDGRTDGANDGRNDGAPSGAQVGALDFDDYVVWLRDNRHEVMPEIGITNRGGGGFRVAGVMLDDVDTLEERIKAKHPGRHDFILRARNKRGHVVKTGELRYETDTAGAAPSSSTAAPLHANDPALAALVDKLVDRVTRLQAPAAATAPVALSEQVGGLGALVATVEKLSSLAGTGAGAARAAAGALDEKAVSMLVDLGRQLERGTSGAGGAAPSFLMEALKMYGGDVKDILGAVWVAAKSKADAAEQQQAAAYAARRAAERAAQATTDAAERAAGAE